MLLSSSQSSAHARVPHLPPLVHPAGNIATSMMAGAIAAYLELYPLLFLPPLILLLNDSKKSNVALKSLVIFTATVAGLLASSYFLIDSWNFIESTYGAILFVHDLTPNIGLWWYFFIEMFNSFRAFFTVVFQLHLVIYVAPLCIKLRFVSLYPVLYRNNPLFVCVIISGIISIFKSYPSVSDLSLFQNLLFFFPEIFSRMRYTFFSTSTLLYTTLLGPAFYHLWIISGTGNANFFYAITLVHTLAQTVTLSDALYAMLRLEWDLQTGKHGIKVFQI
ncbi:Phosphatidylinositol glycan anchor biosynthesis class U protein [Neolecta irregularis DAH-3]|uniref:Phosphatidylinositol glycan anchor biosynthesis class U protein n=1 Tax=Neolecta irregularis (strain DAH-3) TaxID=1198029 RepID=A0A1U7LL74_NEOID|nr:Phosphatidylinositol glycan anchor biosynthesis class U protein [Neolecta irregularis DAH-3]|eukprot:OLL23416.1 Phosphatidylinositol glycan anchor biosynthesis class U protein [Neolecta irregularis DAH-3]